MEFCIHPSYDLLYFNVVSGRFFGIKEYKYLPIGDVGFRFHLSTFLVFFIVSYTMYHYGFMSKWETREILDITLLIWTTILFTHLIFYLKSKRNNIKGMNKEDIFE